MDTTLKQRILGVVVLVGLLGFCLTVLLHNTKTEPHIQKINTHPAFAQSMPTVETPNSVFTKPAETPSAPITPTTTIPTITLPSNTKTSNTEKQNKSATQNITDIQKTMPVQTAAIPTPVILSTPTTTSATPHSTGTAVKAPEHIETQNAASIEHPEMNLTGGSPTSSATSAMLVTTPSTTPSTTPAEKPHHKQHHHREVIAAKSEHRKQTAKSSAAAGDKKNNMVQVGTFSIRANAETLVDKLHRKGFVAVGEKMKTSKGEMTRVIVGKKGLDHAEAETLRKSLEKSIGINGIIISHSKN